MADGNDGTLIVCDSIIEFRENMSEYDKLILILNL